MIPIRSQNKLKRFPALTIVFAVACAAVMIRLATMSDSRAGAIVEALAVVPTRLLRAAAEPGQLLTLVTASFMHAGWIHLIGNLLYLGVFGPPAEDRLGHTRFAAIYLASGVIGLATHVATHPHSSVPLVGASAAIAGILGANLVLLPRTKITAVVPVLVSVEVASLPAAFLIGVWALLQAAAAVSNGTHAATTVAFEAHLGGFIAGAALALPVAAKEWTKRKRRPARRR